MAVEDIGTGALKVFRKSELRARDADRVRVHAASMFWGKCRKEE